MSGRPPEQAEIEAARLLLSRMGVSPKDLVDSSGAMSQKNHTEELTGSVIPGDRCC